MSAFSARNIRKKVGIKTGTKIPTTATFTFTAGASTVANVEIALKDQFNNTIAEPRSYDVYLSDSALGVGLTATTASGTVQAKSASGTVISALTAKKYIRVQALTTGLFTLEITDTSKTGFYVCVVNPATGEVIASRQMVTADYGA